MARSFALIFILAVGGCVSDRGNTLDATAQAPSAKTASETYKQKSLCQDTSIGSESKTVCY